MRRWDRLWRLTVWHMFEDVWGGEREWVGKCSFTVMAMDVTQLLDFGFEGCESFIWETGGIAEVILNGLRSTWVQRRLRKVFSSSPFPFLVAGFVPGLC